MAFKAVVSVAAFADGDHPRCGDVGDTAFSTAALHTPPRPRRRRRDRRTPRRALSRWRPTSSRRAERLHRRIRRSRTSARPPTSSARKRPPDAVCRGFPDAVVWNPDASAPRHSRSGTGGERHFVCIEAAAVQEPVTIGPRRRWSGTNAHRLLTCPRRRSPAEARRAAALLLCRRGRRALPTSTRCAVSCSPTPTTLDRARRGAAMAPMPSGCGPYVLARRSGR